jgi:adenosylcobinamide kinase/adenosylcobinamide-phosphate guanylyltransferase
MPPADLPPPPGSLWLLLGAARSGKSRHAVETARTWGLTTVYLATATAGDAEMADRIRRHRRERPVHWMTVEEPLHPARPMSRLAPGTVVILDCLTVWVANLLLAAWQEKTALKGAPTPVPPDRALRQAAAITRRRALSSIDAVNQAVRRRGLRLLAVSNEVGAGLVPPYPLGRLYRDLLGEVNQRLAARADRVVYLVAGIPLVLKEGTAAETPSAPERAEARG